jgi:hypothetical protein
MNANFAVVNRSGDWRPVSGTFGQAAIAGFFVGPVAGSVYA